MFHQKIRVEREIAGRTLALETGTYAKLAAGAVTIQYGETFVFGAIVRSDPRPGIDFFPLQVEYRERRSAAGKFPGGFLKREGRPTNKEILTARLVDRPLRPLFPKGFMDEVQIHLNVLAFDNEQDPDVLAGIAASAATHISDVPFTTPTAHVRVGKIDGEFVLFPTVEQMNETEFDLVVAGTRDYVNMIEIGANETPEDEVADAIEFGHRAVVEIIGMIDELRDKAGRPKVGEIDQTESDLKKQVRELAAGRMKEVKGKPGKADRGAAMKALRSEVFEQIAPTPGDDATFNQVNKPAGGGGEGQGRLRRGRGGGHAADDPPAAPAPTAAAPRTSARSPAKWTCCPASTAVPCSRAARRRACAPSRSARRRTSSSSTA